MGAYDLFYLGWAKETTPGTSTILNAAGTAYLFGSTVENTPLPDPDWETDEYQDWGSRASSSVGKTVPTLTTTVFSFLPHNALPVWFAIGKSATLGTVHTLTAATQSSGIIPDLPSLTFHAERLDSGAVLTDWVTQYKGMRNVAARFLCGDDDPELTAIMGWTGMSAAKQAFKLTNKPADVTGTYTTPLHYQWGSCTHKYDGTTVEGVTHWEIIVENGTHAIPPQYGSQWPEAVYQGGHQSVRLLVRYKPQVLTLHDDLLAQAVPSKNWTFEFVRHAANDKLLFTCTTAGTIRHQIPHPVHAGEFAVELEAIVTNLTVTATDQIAASAYGE